LATAVIAAGVALAQSARPTSAFPIDRGQRWGKGPYCQTDVPSPEELLASVCPSLGDSATQGVSGGASPQGEPSPTGENTPPITSRLRELAQIAHQLLYPPPNTVAP